MKRNLMWAPLYLPVVLILVLLGLTVMSGQRYESGGMPSMVYHVIASDAPGTMRRGGPNVSLCDGTADDVQIQAVNDLIAAGTGKGVIELSLGSFAISATLLIDSNVTLQGAGEGKTILTLDDDVDNPLLANADWAEMGDANVNIAIYDITFDGNGPNQTDTGASIAIKDDQGNTGTLFFNEMTGLRIERCEIFDAAQASICMAETVDAFVADNKIDNSDDDAIAADQASSKIVITHNIITTMGGDADFSNSNWGVEVQDGATDVIVANNSIECATTFTGALTAPGGISVNSHPSEPSCTDVVITGNTITNAQSSAVQLIADHDTAWCSNIVVANNIIRYNSSLAADVNTGVFALHRCSDTIVTGNIIYKSDDNYITGFFIAEATDLVVSNNSIIIPNGGTAASDGAFVFNDAGARDLVLTRVKITGNTFTNIDNNYFRTVASNNPVFIDVEISGNRGISPNVSPGRAFTLADQAETFTRCIWRDNNWGELNDNVEFTVGASSVFPNGWWLSRYTHAIADNSNGGTHATLTLQPTVGQIEITCADPQGSTITVSETGAKAGMACTIIFTGSTHADFADQANVLELKANAAMELAAEESLHLVYRAGAWREVYRVEL